MKSYSGFYHNKIVNQPVEVTITLLPNSMVVKNAEGKGHEWFYGMLKSKQNKDGSLRLIHEGKLSEAIDVLDGNIVHEIKRLAPYTMIDEFKPWWKTANGLYILLATKFGIVVMGVGIYFLLVPFMIDLAVNHISVETEKNLGDKIKDGFYDEAPLDSQKTNEVNEFIAALKTPEQDRIHVSVLKSEKQNAFALPGADIMIYSGIFDVMKGYPELMALLGHEIGHIEKRHSLKLLCRQTTSGILLMVALGNFSQVTSVIFSNANLFHQLSYNRGYEEEADEYALAFMQKNQVEQTGMADLFEHLKDGDKHSANMQFLSTHPLIEKRISKVLNTIQAMKISSSGSKALSSAWEKIKGSRN